MRSYQNSDYAINKHSTGLVYRFADGIVEITLADYLAENPGKTEDDFCRLKEWSDTDYLNQDRNEYNQTRKNVPLDTLAETALLSTPSPEVVVIDLPEETERLSKRTALGMKVWKMLTEVQRRRFWLYRVYGLSTWKIAEAEGVNQSKIVKSLSLAQKKIDKYLAE